MCAIVRATRRGATCPVELERAAEPTTRYAERRSPLGACRFQLLACGDQRPDEFNLGQSDVDAESLEPLLLLQARKLQLRDLHAQAGPLLSGAVDLDAGGLYATRGRHRRTGERYSNKARRAYSGLRTLALEMTRPARAGLAAMFDYLDHHAPLPRGAMLTNEVIH
jgi:hypothetical protein